MVRLTQLRGFKRIVYKIFYRLGLVKYQPITKERKNKMCMEAQGICSHDCDICIWGTLND